MLFYKFKIKFIIFFLKLLELSQFLFSNDFAYSCQHVLACFETSATSEKLNRSWDYSTVNGHQFSLKVEPIFLGIFLSFCGRKQKNWVIFFSSFFFFILEFWRIWNCTLPLTRWICSFLLIIFFKLNFYITLYFINYISRFLSRLFIFVLFLYMLFPDTN